MSDSNYTGENSPILSICDFDSLCLVLGAYQSLFDTLPEGHPMANLFFFLNSGFESSLDALIDKSGVKKSGVGHE